MGDCLGYLAHPFFNICSVQFNDEIISRTKIVRVLKMSNELFMTIQEFYSRQNIIEFRSSFQSLLYIIAMNKYLQNCVYIFLKTNLKSKHDQRNR